MRRVFLVLASLLAALLVWGMASPPARQDKVAEALDFFAGQGCAMGPSTIAAAGEAGIGRAAIRALTREADSRPDTIRTGDWLVLPPGMCRMRIPGITSEISLDDPEVIASIGAIDEFAAEGIRGCFLDPEALMDRLRTGRGWEAGRAYDAYRRLIAGSLARGEATFFSADPLTPPRQIQFVTGDCGAGLDHIDLIRQDHEFMMVNFDPMIRATAAGVLCDSSAPDVFDVYNAKGMTGETRNMWLNFLLPVILTGAGWYEGFTLNDAGIPRPPLCTYPAAG